MYEYVWGHFIAIWQQCTFDFGGNRIFTYATINEYVKCMCVNLTVYDKRMIFKIKAWAEEQIAKMKEKDDED